MTPDYFLFVLVLLSAHTERFNVSCMEKEIKEENIYRSVSSGRELARSYVIIFKKFENCCDQTGRENLVFSTFSEISFHLDY